MSWVDLTDDPDAGKSNKHDTIDNARELGRGTGRSNVQLVVLTPRGRLLHVTTGYLKPKELLWELEQALGAWEVVKAAARMAELDIQKAALKRHQDEIHARYVKAFTKPGARNNWLVSNEKHDREVVRKHPLVHAGNLRTRDLTGKAGGHFGYQTGGGASGATPTRGGSAAGSGNGGGLTGRPGVRETEAAKRRNKRRAKLFDR